MKKKRKSRRILSLLLVFSMLLSYIPENVVHAASLTYSDTTENQDVFGFTYTENGQQRNMYLYNSADGKVKLTGDILFTTGSYGYYQVRHYDGYLELPMGDKKVKQAILIQHGELYTGSTPEAQNHQALLDLRILDEDGNLYSFNANGYEILTLVKENVTKIDDVFYLSENGKMGAIFPHAAKTGTKATYGIKYWYDYDLDETNVKDFQTIAPTQSHIADTFFYQITENTHFYIKYQDDSQKIKHIERVQSGADVYELKDSELAIPVIDDANNILTIDNIDTGVSEESLWLKDDDVNLAGETPTSTTETSKTYSVMDDHVTITIEKASASATKYTKLIVQTDSAETISYDSATGAIKTGYQDIILSSGLSGRDVYCNAEFFEGPDDERGGRAYATNNTAITCEIKNEVPDISRYSYDIHVNVDTSNESYGLCFSHSSAYVTNNGQNQYEIGEGLVSAWKPKNLEFSEIRTGDVNVYNHILDFNKNRHYVYKNHSQIAEYPMNFKEGETDTPYTYVSNEWQLKVYAKYYSDNNIWRPFYEFTYAPTASHTGNYPNIEADLKMINPVKRLIDNGDGTYSRPNASDDYNIFRYTEIKNINIGNTTIKGSSVEELTGMRTSVYDMSGGNCVQRAADYTDNTMYYDVTDEGKLYKGDIGRALIATNVVKVESSGKYLTANGDVFDSYGDKIKENVINITDNLYQTADGTWRYMSSDNVFNLDAADEHNLGISRAYANNYKKITYTFSYDENEITSVKDENGDVVANGDTREYSENGTHTFTLTNKYGNTYTKNIIVTGFYDRASDDKPYIKVLNSTVTLEGKEGQQLQYKKASDENWTNYTEPFAYEGEFLYRIKGGAQMQAEIDETTGKLVVTDLSSGTFTPNDYFVNAVWDGGNMRYYDKDNETFKLAYRGMQEGSIKDLYPNAYDDGSASTFYGYDDKLYRISTTYGGPEKRIMPIYGFIGPQIPSDRKIGNGGYYTTYSNWRDAKSASSNNMPFLGNFTLLAGEPSSLSSIGVKSEDIFHGSTEIEPVVDGSHMLELYKQTTNQDASFVKAFMDGVYNWLVTDTGQILRSAASKISADQGRIYYDGFVLEEIADDVTNVDEDYIVSTISGYSPGLGYGKDNAKYYLNADIEANGGNIEGVEESGDTIIASSGSGMNRRALAANGNYYVAKDENNMVSYDHVTPFANQLDYEVSTTNWTNELVNVTPKIGSQLSGAGPYGTHYEMHLLENTAHPEWANATVGSGGTNQSTAGTSYEPSTLYNGKYRLDLVDNYSSKVLAAPIITINNIDTVKPSVAISDTTDNKYTFAGQDEEGTYTTEEGTTAFDGIPSAVSGIKNLYYSLDNTTEVSTWDVLDKPVKYVAAGSETGATDTIELNAKTIYVCAVDNAGNTSDIQAFNIGLDLTPTVTYRSGETDLSFYADDDIDHDNDEYSYSYTVGSNTTDGYEKTFTDDTTVTINGTRTPLTGGNGAEASKDVPIIVLKPGSPTISDIDKTTRSVTVTAGTPSHMTFKELWIKVDDGEPVKYTDGEKVITFDDYGYHTITAYQVGENTDLAGGPYTFNGNEVTKRVEDPEPVTIYPKFEYEKGKTTVTFYANSDRENDDDRWTYKYTVEGDTEKDGYTFEVTEDTTAELFAEVNNGGLKSNGTKTIDIYVMDSDKPFISDVPKNGNTSTITAGDIKNDTLEKLEYKIDDEPEYREIDSGDAVTIPTGWHTVYAKQTTGSGMVTESERRVYVSDLDITHKIKHGNGYTSLTFEDKNPEGNPDLRYTYDREDDDEEEIVGQGLVTDVPTTVKIKETDSQGNDDEDTVQLDIVKTAPPTISVNDDKVSLTPGEIENATLIKMYISFDNETFTPYNGAIPLDMEDVTVYAYQEVRPNNQGDDDDIVRSEISQANILKYDVEFVDKHGNVLKDGYSHVVLTGTSVTERAVNVPNYTVRKETVTEVINEHGEIISFVYDGNPVDVTIYHLDAENNNEELDKDVLKDTPLETVLKASELTKSFKGYKYKEADPETLTVSNNNKIMNIYYGYDDFGYTVHYVDKKGNTIHDDKQATAQYTSTVTEKAIDITGYELADDETKTITIKADNTKNEITFVYKKIIVPRKAIITGQVTDEDGNPIAGGVVTLKKKQGFINDVLQLLGKDTEEVSETVTNEAGWYLYNDIAEGVYTLSICDKEKNSLAEAEINVARTDKESEDSITIKSKGEYVTTDDKIDGDRFIVNVSKTHKPVTVTIYHLDAENNNAELGKDELPNTAVGTILKSSDYVKGFKGYAYSKAEAETITVSKDNNVIRLYYVYADSNYTVHYVDEDKKPIAKDKVAPAKSRSSVTEKAIEIKGYLLKDEAEKTIVINAEGKNEIWFVYEKIVINPPLFSMYKEIVLKKNNSFTINLQGITKNAVVKSEITGKSKSSKGVVKIKQKKNGNVEIIPRKVGKTQVTCTIIQNGAEYTVKVDIKVLRQYKGTSRNYDIKKNGLVKTSGELPEFNVYKRIVKGKNTKIKFTQVDKDAKVKFYVANKKEAKSLKIGKTKRKGKTATCTIKGTQKGWVHLTAEITQNGKTYYTRLLVRIDDRSQTKEEIQKQIHKYLE